MKIILLAKDINPRIKTMLKLKFQAELIHSKTGDDAKHIIQAEDDICIIIGDGNTENSETLIEYLENVRSIIPFIDISEGEIASKKVEAFLENQEDVVRAAAPIDTKVLEQIISSAVKVFQKRLSEKFREIKVDHLKNLDQAICEIFIKLSPIKYIKYIDKGSKFTNDIINDLIKRKVKKLYVDSEYIGEFSNQATTKLLEVFNRTDLTAEDKHELSIISNDTIKLNLKNLGVSLQTLDLGHKTLVCTASVFSNEKKLEPLIDILTKSSNYEGEHCVLVSYIAMAMLKVSKMNNPENHLKLCSAALLHDASLIGTGLNTLGDTTSSVFQKLDPSQKKLFLKNPEESSKSLLEFTIFPKEAHQIILQQGERPGGTGFPNGLDSDQVDPLSCIFILTHDFVHKVYHLGMTPENKGIVLAELENIYNEGNFLDAYNLLEKCLV